MDTPTPEQQALAQIQNMDPDSDAYKDGAKTAKRHAEQFVGIIADEYHPDQAAVVQFTVAYFQHLKENIDKGIMEL